MDEASSVDFPDSDHHLHQDLYRDPQVVPILQDPSSFCKVTPKQVHNDEILLHALYIAIGIGYML